MKNPKVSVVIPAYNHEKYVGEAIQSVLDQTFQDFELIIINDGSTDNTEAEILKFKDDRIRYYSQENRGLSATLNRGIELAKGEYFNFLPSDDALLPEKLEVQLKVFREDSNLGLVFAYPQLVDAEGREIGDDPVTQWAIVPYETKEEIFPALFERDFLSAPSALIKMECFEKLGRFDESLKTAQDFDMWMRILKYYDLRLMKIPLIKYRWHGENLTYQATAETEMERSKILLKAYKYLALEDIFPVLRHKKDAFAYAEAYEKLASYMEKSGVPALIPISQIYRDQGKSLIELRANDFGLEKEEEREEFEFKRQGKDDRKINILIETRSLDRGGMEEAIYAIATHLDPDFFYPMVVCIERGGDTADRLKKKGIPVEILGIEKETEYFEILKRYHVDIVNSHYSFFGSRIAQQHGIPVTSVLHNLYSWYSGGILDEFRIADQYVSKYIAVSNQVASFFEYRFNIGRSRIEIIPDGIDLQRFGDEKITKEISWKDLGFENEDFIFLHVGAITPAKMQNLLIAAMKEISKNYPNIKMVSLGSELDKDYLSFIQKKVEEHRLGECLKFIGFVENPTAYYRIADAFLLPSLIEGWGIATLEAMYHNLPLILTKVGGAEELIENEDIGILIKNCCEDLFQLSGKDLEYYSRLDLPKNTHELAAAMLNVYMNPKEWKEKAQKGRRKVLSHYTWDQIIARYEKEFIPLAFKKERENSSFLTGLARDQERKLNEQRKEIGVLKEELDLQRKGMAKLESRIEQQAKEMKGQLVSMTGEFQQRFSSMNQQLDYILVRLSVKERIRQRFFKFMKTIHKIVPVNMRKKYRSQYRRFFFDEAFPDKKISEPSFISQDHLPTSSFSVTQKDTGIDFFIFPIIDWELRYQRPQQIAERLVKRGHRVFFMRTQPILTANLFLSVEEIQPRVRIEEFKKGLYFVTLVSHKNYNIYQDLLQDEASLRYLSFSLEGLKNIFGIRHTVSLVELPFWFPLITHLPNNKIIYDCMDDHAYFSTNNPVNMIQNEKALLQRADLVLASSGALFQKAIGINQRTMLVRNAGDTEHFSVLPDSDVLANISRPILGYYGAISDWFDSHLVAKCAKAFPAYQFVLIGNTFGADLSPLHQLANVHFLGEIPYGELPKYLRYFDVCLIPFKITPLTQAANPVKFYEYLCTGKPIVSVALPELAAYQQICYYSNNEDEFVSNIKKALSEKDDLLRERRIEISKNNSWDQRIDQILEATRELHRKVSVIIVTYNNVEYLKLCLESIFLYSRYPNMEIIVVDNHSQDGTKEYLKEMQQSRDNIIAVINQDNKGFAGGNNEGLKVASGEYIVLLNDDTIVTRDWIPDLVSCLEKTPRLGMVGPVSNFVGNIQKIKANYKKEMGEIQTWAWQYTKQQADDYRSIDMLGFFCIMIKREVFEKVGFLDENYETGMFEDDDYCRRVRKEGYELGYTKKVYIHHEGSVSFKKLNFQEHQKIWEKNKNYFEKKWKVKWFNDLAEFDEETLRKGKTGIDLREYYRYRLQNILKRNEGPIVIFPPLIDWYTPVFQRPPHVAEYLSKAGHLVFFCTENQKYDKVEGFLELKSHLYLTDEFELLKNSVGRDVFHFICSTDQRTTYSELEEEIRKGRRIIYDYIDEIHESITGAIPELMVVRHRSILKDERFTVLATSDKLYREVLSFRKRNCALVTNGVEYEHFHQTFSASDVPKGIEHLVKKKSPIIGYFGSLAAWFDYELLIELAEKRPDFEILLIGYSYDGSITKYPLGQYRNISIMGPIEYRVLPRYAHWFDVSMIPFRVNEITEAASPIKLFEYMALGRPIVTTDMAECRKYKSVLIGKDHKDFIQKIDDALAMKNDIDYSALLEREARENTWESRVELINNLLRGDDK